jgi:hypothetical protein
MLKRIMPAESWLDGVAGAATGGIEGKKIWDDGFWILGEF